MGTFKDGPSIPDFLRAISLKPRTPEDTFLSLIKDLQHSWDANDALLRREAQLIRVGVALLGAASLASIGLYCWALN